MDHYLFISSQDAQDLHPENTSTDFTIELPRTYELTGDWEVALKEIELRIKEDLVYICSDICEESYAHGSLVPILQSARRERKNKAVFHFTDPYYLPIRTHILTKVGIIIRGRDLQSLPKDKTVVYCTLHLRKKSCGPRQ